MRALIVRLALGLLALAAATASADPAPPSLQEATRPVPVTQPTSALPAGWQHGAFAEIFVRGYRDSDGDGIGDLRGLTQSLDYLHDLGVRGLWLMPVTASGDHDHGYSVADFRAIEPAYGTLEDFDELLRQAHARGIGVIVDYVVNHASDANVVFQASQDPRSPYRDWFVWRDDAPTGWEIFGRNPWEAADGGGHYFAQFSRHMPDFNMLSPAVVAFHEDNLRFWLDRGVDGFRFDAVPHLVEHGPKDWYDQPEDRVLMARLRKVVEAYPRRYIVCEATGNETIYAGPDVCGGAFAIWQAPLMVKATAGELPAIRKVADYYLGHTPAMAMMLSNHDRFAGRRLWDQVDGDPKRYRLAAATYLLMPGTPFIFYGEEIGMAGARGLPGDTELRIPMSWRGEPTGFSSGTPFRPPSANAATQNVAAEQARADGLLAWYRALLALRNAHPALSSGSYEAPTVQGRALAYRRVAGQEQALVMINYGSRPQRLRLRALAQGPWRGAFPQDAPALTVDASGEARIDLPPQSVRVLVTGSAPPR